MVVYDCILLYFVTLGNQNGFKENGNTLFFQLDIKILSPTRSANVNIFLKSRYIEAFVWGKKHVITEIYLSNDKLMQIMKAIEWGKTTSF